MIALGGLLRTRLLNLRLDVFISRCIRVDGIDRVGDLSTLEAGAESEHRLARCNMMLLYWRVKFACAMAITTAHAAPLGHAKECLVHMSGAPMVLRGAQFARAMGHTAAWPADADAISNNTVDKTCMCVS